MPFNAPMLDPPEHRDASAGGAAPPPPPAPDADALPADDAAVAPFFGDGPAPAPTSDAADDDDGGGDVSDGGGGDLSRRCVAARRLAAVRRLHAAYARQARVLKAAVKAAEQEETGGARLAGCPREVHPGPLAHDGATPADEATPAPSLTAAPAGWRGALTATAPPASPAWRRPPRGLLRRTSIAAAAWPCSSAGRPPPPCAPLSPHWGEGTAWTWTGACWMARPPRAACRGGRRV